MGGFISGVVNAAKSVWNTVKSFANDCWETTKYIAKNTYQTISHVVNTVREVYETKINGHVVKMFRNVKAIASKVISDVLNKCELLLLVILEKFVSIYLTAKMIFGPKKQEKKVQPVIPQKQEQKQKQKQDVKVVINPNPNKHNFDDELKERELDHSKGFLEDVKSYIREMENSKGL